MLLLLPNEQPRGGAAAAQQALVGALLGALLQAHGSGLDGASLAEQLSQARWLELPPLLCSRHAHETASVRVEEELLCFAGAEPADGSGCGSYLADRLHLAAVSGTIRSKMAGKPTLPTHLLQCSVCSKSLIAQRLRSV